MVILIILIIFLTKTLIYLENKSIFLEEYIILCKFIYFLNQINRIYNKNMLDLKKYIFLINSLENLSYK